MLDIFQTIVPEGKDIHKGAIPEKVPSLTDETLWHAAGFFYESYKKSYNGRDEIM